MVNGEAMTLGIFIGTIICAIVAVGAIVGCLVFLYKSGEERGSDNGANLAGVSIFCGVAAAGAIFGIFTLTRNVVWTFII